jgi:hypothetical protein
MNNKPKKEVAFKSDKKKKIRLKIPIFKSETQKQCFDSPLTLRNSKRTLEPNLEPLELNDLVESSKKWLVINESKIDDIDILFIKNSEWFANRLFKKPITYNSQKIFEAKTLDGLLEKKEITHIGFKIGNLYLYAEKKHFNLPQNNKWILVPIYNNEKLSIVVLEFNKDKGIVWYDVQYNGTSIITSFKEKFTCIGFTQKNKM